MNACDMPIVFPWRFCSFCAKATNRKDNFRYTHTVKDPVTGEVTCPFLRIHTCKKCYTQGHTAKHCTQADVLISLRLYSLLSEGSSHHPFAKNQFDQELLRQETVKTLFEMEKECGFCKHSWKSDTYYKTHTVDSCPRLACLGVISFCAYSLPEACTSSVLPF